MNLGIDIDLTIDRDPDGFRKMMELFMLQGHGVYVITGRGTPGERFTQLDSYGMKVNEHYTSIEIVNDGSADRAALAAIKVIACKRLGVSLMIDDMPEVCNACMDAGILALCLLDNAHSMGIPSNGIPGYIDEATSVS